MLGVWVVFSPHADLGAYKYERLHATARPSTSTRPEMDRRIVGLNRPTRYRPAAAAQRTLNQGQGQRNRLPLLTNWANKFSKKFQTSNILLRSTREQESL